MAGYHRKHVIWHRCFRRCWWPNLGKHSAVLGLVQDEPALRASGRRAPAQPSGGGTQAGRLLLSCPSWTPRTQIVRCPRNRGNFRKSPKNRGFVGILRGQKCLKRPQPVGLNELGLHIRHPAYRPDPTIPRRRHRPADQWRSERRREPCTVRLGCHAPLCLTADAERPPAEEIMSIGGAHGARRGTGPTYLDCPLSRGALSLILQNHISRGSGSPEIKLHRDVRGIFDPSLGIFDPAR